MKISNKYILNENLDLKGENFIIKKGTIMTLLNKFDQNDDDKPTSFGLKFENINGVYHANENYLNQLVTNNLITFQEQPRFSIGSCVKRVTNQGISGIVMSSTPDKDLINTWLYGVRFPNEDVILKENQLREC